jgi:hypothetical protein
MNKAWIQNKDISPHMYKLWRDSKTLYIYTIEPNDLMVLKKSIEKISLEIGKAEEIELAEYLIVRQTDSGGYDLLTFKSDEDFKWTYLYDSKTSGEIDEESAIKMALKKSKRTK